MLAAATLGDEPSGGERAAGLRLVVERAADAANLAPRELTGSIAVPGALVLGLLAWFVVLGTGAQRYFPDHAVYPPQWRNHLRHVVDEHRPDRPQELRRGADAFRDYLHVRLAQPDTRCFGAFGYAVKNAMTLRSLLEPPR